MSPLLPDAVITWSADPGSGVVAGSQIISVTPRLFFPLSGGNYFIRINRDCNLSFTGVAGGGDTHLTSTQSDGGGGGEGTSGHAFIMRASKSYQVVCGAPGAGTALYNLTDGITEVLLNSSTTRAGGTGGIGTNRADGTNGGQGVIGNGNPGAVSANNVGAGGGSAGFIGNTFANTTGGSGGQGGTTGTAGGLGGLNGQGVRPGVYGSSPFGTANTDGLDSSGKGGLKSTFSDGGGGGGGGAIYAGIGGSYGGGSGGTNGVVSTLGGQGMAILDFVSITGLIFFGGGVNADYLPRHNQRVIKGF